MEEYHATDKMHNYHKNYFNQAKREVTRAMNVHLSDNAALYGTWLWLFDKAYGEMSSTSIKVKKDFIPVIIVLITQ